MHQHGIGKGKLGLGLLLAVSLTASAFFGPAPFSIAGTQVDSTNGMCTVAWEAALNQRFDIQRSADLSSWTTIETGFPTNGADGAMVSYTDPSVSPSQTFYRVARPYDPEKKPNVLLLVVDDLRDHEEFAGANTVHMPNLDRLAARGIKFNHAYCQATFCNPSRASFLTGLRPDTTGIANNQDFFRDSTNAVVANAVTLPQCFRTNGYYTASLGKILHGTQLDPPSWDLQQNTFSATPAGNSGEWVNMTSNAVELVSWCRWRAPECEDDDLGDGIMALQAVEILREKRDEPFFLAVGFKKPHDPFVAPRKYFDMYPLTNLVLHVDPADASPAPPLAVPNNANKRAFDAMDDSDRLEFLRCYAACSSYSDAQIGKVLDAMDELGLWQTTIVILWTDHGYHQGERGWWNKTYLYDYDAKVPLMAYVPQMPFSNMICTGVVELVDIYPTLAELAGLDPPGNLEGESFVPLIEDPAQTWNAVGVSQKSTGRTVCDGHFRYTEWTDGEKELYDHNIDPGEWYNLSSNSTYSAVMQTMSLWLQ
ncbi:MAG: sulfatase [Kiritimatiellales bacterium]|nr:sulfatase [Kiritimatiellales bacterium]